jgi:hypothetical protein
MHPVIYHDLAQARIADLHRQAQRDANARVVSRGRHARAPHGARGRELLAAIARQLLIVLGQAHDQNVAAQAHNPL